MRCYRPFGDAGRQIREPKARAAHAAGLPVLRDLRTLSDVSGRHSQRRVQHPCARRPQPRYQAARQDSVQLQGLYGRAFCRNDRMEFEGDRGHQNRRMRRSVRDLPGRVDALKRRAIVDEDAMKQSAVEAVIRGLKKAGVSVVCYLPDSLFKELYPALDADPDIRTIRVTNEGEGAAICGGVFLSGKKAALVMENSGLRASVEPVARLGLGAGIPVVMLMSYRGELGENNWWAIPHGITMEPVLDALRIPYQVVREEDKIERAISDAYAWSYASYYHSAVALAGEVVR